MLPNFSAEDLLSRDGVDPSRLTAAFPPSDMDYGGSADLAGLAAVESGPLVPEYTADLHLGNRNCRVEPKLRYDLIPPEADHALAAVLTYGATKYAPRNWEKGLRWSEDIIGSLKRHLAAFEEGEVLDPESGLPHVWHVQTNAAMLVTMAERRPDLNDLPAYKDHT